MIRVTYFRMEKKSRNIKLVIKIITFHFNFVLEAYLINMTMMIQKKYLLKEMCMIFSVDYVAIEKSNILHIHRYLMIKNSI